MHMHAGAPAHTTEGEKSRQHLETLVLELKLRIPELVSWFPQTYAPFQHTRYAKHPYLNVSPTGGKRHIHDWEYRGSLYFKFTAKHVARASMYR